MADVNQIITLGIGTPSDIPHFILFGLSINADVLEPVADVTVTVKAKPRTIVVQPDPTVRPRRKPGTVVVT